MYNNNSDPDNNINSYNPEQPGQPEQAQQLDINPQPSPDLNAQPHAAPFPSQPAQPEQAQLTQPLPMQPTMPQAAPPPQSMQQYVQPEQAQQPEQPVQAQLTQLTPQHPPVQCPRCNAVSSNKFCSNCGFNVAGFIAAEQARQQAYNQQPNQFNQQAFHTTANQMWYPPVQPKKKNTAVVVLIVTLCVFFVLVACGIFLFSVINYIDPGSGYSQKDDIAVPSNPFDSDIFGDQNPFTPKSDGASSNSIYPNGVNKEEYEKITKGMTYAQVSGIIGGDGVMSDSGQNLKNEQYYTYSWGVEDSSIDTVLHLTFVDKVVSEILLDGDF